MRIPARWGGSDMIYTNVMVCNDTGSSAQQTVLDTPDLLQLGLTFNGSIIPHYTGWLRWQMFNTAAGQIQRL